MASTSTEKGLEDAVMVWSMDVLIVPCLSRTLKNHGGSRLGIRDSLQGKAGSGSMLPGVCKDVRPWNILVCMGSPLGVEALKICGIWEECKTIPILGLL